MTMIDKEMVEILNVTLRDAQNTRDMGSKVQRVINVLVTLVECLGPDEDDETPGKDVTP